MTNLALTLGQRLRAIREEHGLTQTALSRALGGFPTPSAISRLEGDQIADPGIYMLAAFARIYGMSRGAFFRQLGVIEEEMAEQAAAYATLSPQEKIAVLLRRHPDFKAVIAQVAGEADEYILHVLEGVIRVEQARKRATFEEEERAYGVRRRERERKDDNEATAITTTISEQVVGTGHAV